MLRRPARLRRGLGCAAGGFVERGAGHVVAEDARRLRGQAIVGQDGADVAEQALVVGDAGRRIRAVHRDQGKEPRMALRHRPVLPADEAQPRDRIEIRRGLADAGVSARYHRVEQVLLARESGGRCSSPRSRAPRSQPAGREVRPARARRRAQRRGQDALCRQGTRGPPRPGRLPPGPGACLAGATSASTGRRRPTGFPSRSQLRWASPCNLTRKCIVAQRLTM